MKYLYLIFILSFFQGCFVSSTRTLNRSGYKVPNPATLQKRKSAYTQRDRSSLYDIEIQTIKKTKKIQTLGTTYSGSIKGIVKKIRYNREKNSWLYEIEGLDTSNHKLPYARFYNHKKLANSGDFVYVILNNSKLKNLFFIKKTNKIVKKYSSNKKRVVNHKRQYKKIGNKISSQIGVPTVENVTF